MTEAPKQPLGGAEHKRQGIPLHNVGFYTPLITLTKPVVSFPIGDRLQLGEQEDTTPSAQGDGFHNPHSRWVPFELLGGCGAGCNH